MRAAALYLRAGGQLAFVLPMAVMSRGQFERLRSGSFQSAKLQYDEAWVMDEGVQPLFPVPSCVVFARRRNTSTPIPDKVLNVTGTLPFRDAPEAIAATRLKWTPGPAPTEAMLTGGSSYRKAFRQGATLVPRMLCLVERASTGSIIGIDASAPPVKSRRSTQEKQPWKSLPGIESKVEREFLRPVLLGESILPYRIFHPFEGVIPVTEKGEVLDSKTAANRGFSGLYDWMTAAQAVWETDKPSDISLIEQFDYYGKLSSQWPSRTLRVVYAKADTLPAACVVSDSGMIVDHKLYWASVNTSVEANFLTSILNSETARKRAESQQSRGQWGARDFDKVIFNLPIPRFDVGLSLHTDLAAAALEAETLAAAVPLPEGVKFQRARRLVRDALAEAGLSQRIDALVARLLDGNEDAQAM